MITTYSAQINCERSARDKAGAGANINSELAGFGVSINIFEGAWYLCKRNEQTYVVGIPCERWKGDIMESGYTVISKLYEYPTPPEDRTEAKP